MTYEKIAYAESRGPQFPVIVRVHGVLGHRAIAAGLLNERELDFAIKALCDLIEHKRYPSLPTTRRWAQVEPSLPENALRSGLITMDGLANWARPHVQAQAKQAARDLQRDHGIKNAEQTAAEGLKTLALIAGGVWVLRKLFGPPNPGNRYGY